MNTLVLAGAGWVHITVPGQDACFKPHEAREFGLRILRAADQAVIEEVARAHQLTIDGREVPHDQVIAENVVVEMPPQTTPGHTSEAHRSPAGGNTGTVEPEAHPGSGAGVQPRGADG